MKAIKDEFSDQPMTRQRRYQLRMRRDHKCVECGEPAMQGTRCLKHLIMARERLRKARKHSKRFFNSLSYRLERENKDQQ